ncbi:hypothetical protein EON67_08405 [archaeon]|nr:MAG: hypothetical protein EON67_08405 [archaeon]
MMKKYLIGRLPETDMSNPTVASASKAGVSKSSDSAKSSGSSITGLLPYAIPVGMLVFAVWFHFFNKTAAAAL